MRHFLALLAVSQLAHSVHPSSATASLIPPPGFALPGATMGAMGASAMSRSRRSDEDEAERLRRAELTASYHSAQSFAFDELIDPREVRNHLLHSLERALHRRQAPAEPVARIGIAP